MNRRAIIAIETLDSLLGHHTAHLEPKEQAQVALALARRCMDTAIEVMALVEEPE